MPKIGKSNYTIGRKYKILQYGKIIDKVILRRIDIHEEIIEIESLEYDPGEKKEFIFSSCFWRMLFNNPMGSGRCFSMTSPVYYFEPM